MALTYQEKIYWLKTHLKVDLNTYRESYDRIFGKDIPSEPDGKRDATDSEHVRSILPEGRATEHKA